MVPAGDLKARLLQAVKTEPSPTRASQQRIAAAILVVVSLFLPLHKKLGQGQTENENLQSQVTDQKILLARQTREVNLLKTDPAYLETMARDKLDLMKEGETIFRLEPPTAPKAKP